MATVNERLQSEAIHHAVDLSHFSNGVVRRIIALLNRVDADLVVQLQLALERMDAQAFTVERLDMLLSSVRQLNAQAYQAVATQLAVDLPGLATEESSYHLHLWQRVLPAELNVASVVPAQVYAAAMARPFQGRLLREWTQSIEAQRMARLRDAVRMGVVEGQTTAQIVQKVRGTRALKFTDGLLDIDRRHAESVVRTAINHVAAVARNEFHAANDDIIKAVKWSSTLDSRTSALCRVRDGLEYSATTHKPLGHSIPWLGGPGQIHWCCRSSSVPVLKGWKELGLTDGGSRASMDGQVPADLKYGDWLKKQSAGRQDDILGPVRGQLLRKGGLDVDRFANEKGKWLTLPQLRERNASAFERAGL
jgi:hypothetical protein